MKVTSILIFQTFFYCNLFAQKVDLDPITFNYSYTKLPSKVLSPEIQTYNVKINSSPATSNYIVYDLTEDAINLEGFNKMYGHENTDLSINVDFGNLLILTSEVKSRVETKKNKSGKEESKRYFWLEVQYTFPISYNLVNNHLNKEIYFSTISSANYKLTYKSIEFDNHRAASNFGENNKKEIRSLLVDNRVKFTTNSISNTLTDVFGYKAQNAGQKFWYLADKKHEAYQMNNQIFQNLKEKISQIRYNEPITSQIINSFDPIIGYFESVKNKYTSNEKNDKKMRYAAYYNLGYIYLILENFKKASQEANLLIENDYDKSDGKQLLKLVEKNQNSIYQSNQKTRHFISPHDYTIRR